MLECHNQAAKQYISDSKMQIKSQQKDIILNKIWYICIICSYKYINTYIFSIHNGFFKRIFFLSCPQRAQSAVPQIYRLCRALWWSCIIEVQDEKRKLCERARQVGPFEPESVQQLTSTSSLCFSEPATRLRRIFDDKKENPPACLSVSTLGNTQHVKPPYPRSTATPNLWARMPWHFKVRYNRGTQSMQPPTSSSLPSFMAPLKGNRWAPLAQPERA